MPVKETSITAAASTGGDQVSGSEASSVDDPTKVPGNQGSSDVEDNMPSSGVINLTAYQLRALKNSNRITIMYRDDDNDEPRVLLENFPKAVAATFSAAWKSELAADQKRKIPSLSEPAKNSIMIKGGHFETYKIILNWMLACCQGTGIARYVDPHIGSFTTAYLVRLCANHIRCQILVNITTERMQHTADNQIHSEDVRALWLMTPPDAAMKEFLVNHIASRLWTKTIRHKVSYWTLRQEMPDFNEAIVAALGALAASYKANKGRGKGRWAGERQGAAGEEGHGQEELVEEAGPLEPSQGHVWLEVVRKGTKGRHSYARLPLADLGVSSEKFYSK